MNTTFSMNHSKLNRLIKVSILKTSDLMVNDYTIYDEIGRVSNDWVLLIIVVPINSYIHTYIHTFIQNIQKTKINIYKECFEKGV